MSTVSATPGAETLRWDIFLCYASEDKERVADPLYCALTGAGIACWYDQAEIRWGDPTAGKIMEGLSASRYVMVILTPKFLKKHYGRFELLTSINDEASTGKVKVLPQICGAENDREEILRKLPVVSGKNCHCRKLRITCETHCFQSTTLFHATSKLRRVGENFIV